MPIRTLGGSKLIIVLLVLVSLLLSSVSPAFAVHNRLRQGYYDYNDYYYYSMYYDAW